VSLCRPRRLTLAARSANALKSTGPRAVRGKARVGFNALKLGLHATRSARFRDRLIRAGYDRQEALYGQIRSRIAQTFGTSTPEQRCRCDALATAVWCLTIRPQARRLLARIMAFLRLLPFAAVFDSDSPQKSPQSKRAGHLWPCLQLTVQG
jgi:hypothetical protein